MRRVFSGHKIIVLSNRERERWEGRNQIKLNENQRSWPPFLDSISRFSVWLCFCRSVRACVERACVSPALCCSRERFAQPTATSLWRALHPPCLFYFSSRFFKIMLGVPEWKRMDRGERMTLCVWQKSKAYCSESNRKSESSPHPWPCACLWSSWTQPNGLVRHLTGRQTWVPSSNLTFGHRELLNTCTRLEEIIFLNRFGTCEVGGQFGWDARCSETGLVV